MPSPLQIGIIGFGRIGAEHASWISSTANARAAAVADPTPARQALAQSRALRTCSQIDQLLLDPSIDAILISTPTAMHFDHASRALAAGKHVMVEKPFALDLAQSQALTDLARKQGRTLCIFHNRRWDQDFLTVQSAMASGLFGKPINVESRLGQWSSCVGPAAREYRPNWRNEASFGGGGLYDWGSHFVDQIWRLMLPAKPLRVFAQLQGNIWTHDCDDFARLLIDFDNGASALVEINTTTTRPLPRWHIDGTTGSADSPFSLTFDIQTWAKLEFAPADGSPPRRIPPAAPGLTEPQIWSQFASACRGESEPPIPPESVLPTMALLDAARQSAATGASISLS